MTTPIDIEAARKLISATTPAPDGWAYNGYGDGHEVRVQFSSIACGPVALVQRCEDAMFIAAAHTLLPAALDEIERLRAADVEWSDICNKQNALLEERHKLASPQICGWCHLAAGDTADTREMATKYTLDEVREHTKSCPNNPLVVEIERLRAALTEALDMATPFDGRHSTGVGGYASEMRPMYTRIGSVCVDDRIAELRKLVTT